MFHTGRWRSFQAAKEDIDDLKLFCKKSKSEMRHVYISMRLTDGLSGAVFNVLFLKNFLQGRH